MMSSGSKPLDWPEYSWVQLLENISLIHGLMGLLAAFHWGQGRKWVRRPLFSDSWNNRSWYTNRRSMLRLEYKLSPGGWRAIGVEPYVVKSREPQRRKTSGKRQESMGNMQAIAVQAYGEGSKRRRGVPGQKAGWRGTVGCKRVTWPLQDVQGVRLECPRENNWLILMSSPNGAAHKTPNTGKLLKSAITCVLW